MLSDYEREQLARIEENLYTDEGFAKATRMGTGPHIKSRAVMVLSVLAGMFVVIVGVATNITLIGVFGYCLMLTGSIIGLRAFGSSPQVGRQ